MELLIACKPKYETILAKELNSHNCLVKTRGDGWILAQSKTEKIPNLCFAQTILINPIKIKTSSVNESTAKLTDIFLASMKGKRIEKPMPALFLHTNSESLSRRVKSVESNWHKKISKIMSRLEKLLRSSASLSLEPVEGFFVYFLDFNQVFVSQTAVIGACQRMHMDSNAPSRAYLKVEEAYTLLNCEPKRGEKVVDLGAAPGGWTYSALKRKAKVIAIDNANLEKTIKNNPNVTQLKEDALKFIPNKSLKIDWLFCDIIEKPEIILEVIHKWLKNGWCKKFIVNLKIGRSDPIGIIKKINDSDTGLINYCSSLRIRQLYHDRQEITLVGKHIWCEN